MTTRWGFIVVAAIFSSGCNTDGFGELPAVYAEKNAIHSYHQPSINQPPAAIEVVPNTDLGEWRYSTTTDAQNRVFIARATLPSVTRYQDDNGNTINGSYLELKREQYSPSAPIEQSVIIYGGIGAKLDCTPSCKIAAGGKVFTMTNLIEAFITGIDKATNKDFYQFMTNAGDVNFHLPVKNSQNSPFIATFHARNFNKTNMLLHSERSLTDDVIADRTNILPSTVLNPVNAQTCQDLKDKACGDMTCTQAKIALVNCGRKELDQNGDGTPCDSMCR